MRVAVFVACLLAGFGAFAADAVYSELWGTDGGKWTPDSRLPDYSFAGYGRGETPIPDAPATHNVRDFGAAGDGEKDDTEAFKRAIAEVGSGVIAIPPGRYVITDIIEIQKPNLVLRGAGRDKTTLYFPKTLTDVRPNWGETTSGRPTSNYSWSGGFVWVMGGDAGEDVAAPGPAKRGGSVLPVADTAPFKPGMELMLVLVDDEARSLTRYMYADDPGDIAKIEDGSSLRQVFRVLGVGTDSITVDRPLRADVRPEWKPVLRRFAPTVTQVGIEGMTFEFPAPPYEGHFTELGHNGIAMNNVAHCWVRDVHFQNAESGIFLHGRFCTVEDVSYDSAKMGHRFDTRGHHGVSLGGEDNVFTRFDFRVKYMHDLTVSSGSIGNVFSNGRGVDINFDHHRRAPYENLFANLDTGKGSRIWSCGGGESLGKHCAARGTFWNIRAASPLRQPPTLFAPPMINIVGMATEQPSEMDPAGRWFEVMDPAALQPQNIHEAQRDRRLRK